ncbi:N-acetylneuraminate lyase isoform X1 [Sphaeramia orbicularis]|uniref:N-acetylneuraminate lyase n=2 Tax=Sphaeramia orbicularis TaxID=375764 RepID=A0A673CE36_9TELE|nr:N-acetylneuraminate lyase isoform X1 [Sphaeramia orbicularis]
MSIMAPAAHRKLTGLVAATFTPLTNQGEINLSVIGPYIDYLTETQGVKSVFVNGTTGEGMSLSVEERKVLAEDWCLKGKGKLDQVIVHVGCTSLKDAQELARHAAQIGVDGISVIAPSFFKPQNAAELRSFLQEVAAAAPNVPFYYYHLPAFTGVNVTARDVLEGIETFIPSYRGVKFTGFDLTDMGQCVSCSRPDWVVLYGMDEQLLAGLVLGVDGAVGSTYNYVGRHMNELITAFENNNLIQARKIQFKLQELITFATKLGFNVGVNKRLMAELSGLHLGPPRLPLTPCAAVLAENLTEKFHSLFPSEQ